MNLMTDAPVVPEPTAAPVEASVAVVSPVDTLPTDPAAVPQGAPEKYDFKLPEDVDFDPSGIDAFSAFAKESNLTQDAAQALLSKMAPAMAKHQQEASQKAVEAIHQEWIGKSQTDKEFGGDALPQNLAVAKRAMEKFGSPELKQMLNESGLGNHPEVIRFFYRAGKAISEDGFVSGQGANSASDDPAKRLFPNMA